MASSDPHSHPVSSGEKTEAQRSLVTFQESPGLITEGNRILTGVVRPPVWRSFCCKNTSMSCIPSRPSKSTSTGEGDRPMHWAPCLIQDKYHVACEGMAQSGGITVLEVKWQHTDYYEALHRRKLVETQK